MDDTSTPHISCVSLGMVILDEIHTPKNPPLTNILGGSATFVTLGLRLFATPSLAPGCLVIAGSDFPPEIRQDMQTWNCDALTIIDVPDQLSSRGLLVYEDNTFGPKKFTYTTPPLRASPKHLLNTRLLSAQAFHFFGPPEEILAQVPELLSYRNTAYPSLPRPFIVWEPLPSRCVPENLPVFKEACKCIDVFSPNHIELAALLGGMSDSLPQNIDIDVDVDVDIEGERERERGDLLTRLTTLGEAFLATLPSNSSGDSSLDTNPSLTLILRAATAGALALQHTTHPIHVPAFHAPGSEKVVDVTGAGNAFLGGYIAGWLGEGSVRGAMEYGAVAAGVAIEQIGVPGGKGVEGQGWGWGRLDEFRGRVE